jgi:hypothetical protein
VPFQFENSSSVLNGSFNIYIFQPAWLITNNLVNPSELAIHYDMNRPGCRLSIGEKSCEWTIRPDRLTILANTAATDCGSLTGKIIELLPHTPLFAIGNNIQFKSSIADIDVLSRRLFGEAGSDIDGYELKQSTWHRSLSIKDRIINIQMSSNLDEATLSVNVHRELQGKGNDYAIKSAMSFHADLDSAIRVTNQLLGLSIEHDHSNHAA